MNVRDYFQAYDDYFWQWESPRCEVLAIPNGSTIAYRELVSKIAKDLAPQGIPPFGSLLLAIIATNPKGRTAIFDVLKIVNKKFDTTYETFAEAYNFLNLLTELPEEYKVGHRKILLFRAIFEDAHNRFSLKKSQIVVARLRNKSKKSLSLATTDLSSARAINDFKVIALLYRKFKTVDDILHKIASLPDFEDTLELEEEVIGEAPEDLIEALEQNSKTQKVGTLVKTIWAGLRIPFHSVIPSQQPLGGVSDLTNKGNFDRLLISEFANEEIVFLSRLANNEALYLSRESPPASNNMKRVILIDVSLKNWGTPKIMAFATMLAIAKHPKTDIECEVFALGKSVHPIQFDSIHGIIDGLQIVEASLDCSEGLAAYFKEYPSEKGRELFVLTENSTQKQTEMRRAMNEFGSQINYWVFNDASGSIDLYKKLKKSKKHVQHIELPLKRLWSKSKKKIAPRKTKSGKHYPIMVASSLGYRGIRPVGSEFVFQLTKEKSLLRLRDVSIAGIRKGWEVFYENLSVYDNEFEIGQVKNGEFVILLFRTQYREITLLNLQTKAEKKIHFHQWKSRYEQAFIFHQEKFYHLNHTGAWSIDLEGNVNESDIEYAALNELFVSRGKIVKQATFDHRYTPPNLKNVKSVGINTALELMFNVHQLSIDAKRIILRAGEKRDYDILAEKTAEGRFEFADGSLVEINRSGFAMLTSSNKSIPTIYVPLVLDTQIGIATDEEFAGWVHYQNEPLFGLYLKDVGTNKINVIKEIKEITKIGLGDSKELMSSAPCDLLYFCTKKEAEQIQWEFEGRGAKVDIYPVTPDFKATKVIDSVVFFQTYIDLFINTIKAHETTHKTS